MCIYKKYYTDGDCALLFYQDPMALERDGRFDLQGFDLIRNATPPLKALLSLMSGDGASLAESEAARGSLHAEKAERAIAELPGDGRARVENELIPGETLTWLGLARGRGGETSIRPTRLFRYTR